MTENPQLAEYLDWRVIRSTPGLPVAEQRRRARQWWVELWQAVTDLKARYDVPVAARWWEDATQVEALAAVSNWLLRYDTGQARDPRGKLQLLLELERIEPLLRGVDCGLYSDPASHEQFDEHVDSLITAYFVPEDEPPTGGY